MLGYVSVGILSLLLAAPVSERQSLSVEDAAACE